MTFFALRRFFMNGESKDFYALKGEEENGLKKEDAMGKSSPIGPLSKDFDDKGEEKSKNEEVKSGLPEENNDRGIKNAARLFGVSEDVMEDEFISFKAEKIIKRLNLDLGGHAHGNDVLRGEILSAAEAGFGSVTVPAARIADGVSFSRSKISVRAAVSYPFGGDTFRAKAVAVRESARQRCAAIEVTLAPFEVTQKKRSTLLREWKKLKRLSAKAMLIMAVDISNLSLSDLKKLADVSKVAGVSLLKISKKMDKVPPMDLSIDGLFGGLGPMGVEVCVNAAGARPVFAALRSGARSVSVKSATAAAAAIKKELALSSRQQKDLK